MKISIELFRKLFVHRDDVFSVQGTSGDYRKIERKLTDQVIEDHLRGQHTIGLYQLKQENDISTIKWACLDIDLAPTVYRVPDFEIKNWNDFLDNQVKRAQEILSEYEISSYVEESGQKGRHIWMFFEHPIDALIVKKAMHCLFDNMESAKPEQIVWEIFPKQVRLSNDYGNLVKMPFSVHQKTGVRGKFLGDLSNVVYTTQKQLEATQSPYEEIFNQCMAFRQLKNIANVTSHLDHNSRLALAYIFWNLPPDEHDYSKHAGAAYIEDKIFSKMSDYDPAYVKREFEFHKKQKTSINGEIKQGYAPITCQSLQSDACGNICPGPCKPIGKSKSPIVFYYRSIGADTSNYDAPVVIKDYRPNDYYIDGHSYCKKGDVKKIGGKTSKEPDVIISNFIIKWDREITYDDGIEEHKIFEGNILIEDNTPPVPFKISAAEFANDVSFRQCLYNTMGAKIYIENDRRLREAIFSHTNTEKVKILKIFGYNKNLDTYLSPSVKVTPEGVFENTDLTVHLDGEKAEVLDLCITSDDIYKDLVEHIREELLEVTDWHVTHTAFAHTMLPIIGPFLEQLDINRYAFLVRGLTGTGKSHLMINMQKFYSPTYRFPITWTSTHNALQRIGFFFKDAMFLIDDLKKKNIEKNYVGTLGLLQNYADGSSRDRMRANTEMQRTWQIRGWIAMTGEDTIESEASNLARMITVRTINTVKKVEIGSSINQWSSLYSAFTARYIHHILNQDKNNIKEIFENYKNKTFYPLVQGKNNDIRMSQNLAQLMTSYFYAIQFLYEDDEFRAEHLIDQMIEFLKSLVITLVEETGEESDGQVLWEVMIDLMARNKVYIHGGNFHPQDKPFPSSEMIGFRGPRDNKIYLLTSFYDTIQKYLKSVNRSLGHSKRAVVDELVEMQKIESHLSTVRALSGNSQRVYILKENCFEDLIQTDGS